MPRALTNREYIQRFGRGANHRRQISCPCLCHDTGGGVPEAEFHQGPGCFCKIEVPPPGIPVEPLAGTGGLWAPLEAVEAWLGIEASPTTPPAPDESL